MRAKYIMYKSELFLKFSIKMIRTISFRSINERRVFLQTFLPSPYGAGREVKSHLLLQLSGTNHEASQAVGGNG